MGFEELLIGKILGAILANFRMFSSMYIEDVFVQVFLFIKSNLALLASNMLVGHFGSFLRGFPMSFDDVCFQGTFGCSTPAAFHANKWPLLLMNGKNVIFDRLFGRKFGWANVTLIRFDDFFMLRGYVSVQLALIQKPLGTYMAGKFGSRHLGMNGRRS